MVPENESFMMGKHGERGKPALALFEVRGSFPVRPLTGANFPIRRWVCILDLMRRSPALIIYVDT